MGVTTNTRNLFLTVLEAQSPRDSLVRGFWFVESSVSLCPTHTSSSGIFHEGSNLDPEDYSLMTQLPPQCLMMVTTSYHMDFGDRSIPRGSPKME